MLLVNEISFDIGHMC